MNRHWLVVLVTTLSISAPTPARADKDPVDQFINTTIALYYKSPGELKRLGKVLHESRSEGINIYDPRVIDRGITLELEGLKLEGLTSFQMAAVTLQVKVKPRARTSELAQP